MRRWVFNKLCEADHGQIGFRCSDTTLEVYNGSNKQAMLSLSITTGGEIQLNCEASASVKVCGDVEIKAEDVLFSGDTVFMASKNKLQLNHPDARKYKSLKHLQTLMQKHPERFTEHFWGNYQEHARCCKKT